MSLQDISWNHSIGVTFGFHPMIEFLTMFALPAVLVAVFVSLVLGLIAMNRSGDKAREQSNTLMRWRVGLHLAALGLIVLIMLLR